MYNVFFRSFPPPFTTGNKSNQWLLDGAAKAWGEWLSPDAIETLKMYVTVN